MCIHKGLVYPLDHWCRQGSCSPGITIGAELKEVAHDRLVPSRAVVGPKSHALKTHLPVPPNSWAWGEGFKFFSCEAVLYFGCPEGQGDEHESMPDLWTGEWYLFLMTVAGCGLGVHSLHTVCMPQVGSVLVGTEHSPSQLSTTAVEESLAVGPGLGGMFAQAHSFTIVIPCKLSLLSSNACFPERWSGGDKSTWQGCVTAASSECFFSPVILHKVQTAFRVFLGNSVQMEKLGLYGANGVSVRAGL